MLLGIVDVGARELLTLVRPEIADTWPFMSIPDRTRTCDLRLRRPYVAGFSQRGSTNASPEWHGGYVDGCKASNLTSLSRFSIVLCRLPRVLCHRTQMLGSHVRVAPAWRVPAQLRHPPVCRLIAPLTKDTPCAIQG